MEFEVLEKDDGEATLAFKLSLEHCEALSGLVREKWTEAHPGQEPSPEEIEDGIIYRTLGAALVEADITLWQEPEISELEQQEDGSLSFIVKLAFLPEVVLPDYHQMQVEIPPVPELDADHLLTRLAELREDIVTRTPVDRAAQMGDELLVHMAGFVGQLPVPMSVRAFHQFELEPEALMPGFAEQLIGLSAGESRDVQVKLAADHPISLLRGKPAVFKVQLLEVQARQVPDLDNPAQLKRLGRGETMEAVMDSIRDELSEENDALWARHIRKQVLDAVMDASEVEIPLAMILNELQTSFDRSDKVMLVEQGVSPELIERAAKAWLAQSQLKDEARYRVKQALVLREIASAEGVVVEEADLEAYLEPFTEVLKQPLDKIRASFDESGELLALADKVLYEKTLDLLLKQARLIYEGKLMSFEDGEVYFLDLEA